LLLKNLSGKIIVVEYRAEVMRLIWWTGVNADYGMLSFPEAAFIFGLIEYNALPRTWWKEHSARFVNDL
jgi:hypothetical protein